MFTRRTGIPAAFAALLLVVVASTAFPDQNDERLDALFEVLKTAGDSQAARAAEAEIWRIWIESGQEEIDALMVKGIAAMGNRQFDDAISIFGQITERAPRFSEGWNKRATAYYLNEDLVASVEDIRRTLALEPRHFGAISGMGLIFLSLGDQAGALNAFEAVLVIHPHSPGARERVEELNRLLRERGA